MEKIPFLASMVGMALVSLLSTGAQAEEGTGAHRAGKSGYARCEQIGCDQVVAEGRERV